MNLKHISLSVVASLVASSAMAEQAGIPISLCLGHLNVGPAIPDNAPPEYKQHPWAEVEANVIAVEIEDEIPTKLLVKFNDTGSGRKLLAEAHLSDAGGGAYDFFGTLKFTDEASTQVAIRSGSSSDRKDAFGRDYESVNITAEDGSPLALLRCYFGEN